jgi:threonine dehydrogenase-like Zn-dependent dehydrogenase
MSTWFRVPDRALVCLPDGLAPRDACLVEPASVAWHGCRTGGVSGETSVAVVGAGAIGLLAAAAAQEMGAPEVAVEARHRHQRETAERLGVGATSDLYDVVIEAGGGESSLHRSVELARPGGTVVVLGVHQPDVEWPHQKAFRKEVVTAPALGYCGSKDGTQREFDEAAAMLADRPELVELMITHRFDLEDAEEAFRLAREKSSGARRVVIHPN